MEPSVLELDRHVRLFYEGNSVERKNAEILLNEFRENNDSWLLVDKILESNCTDESKYLALQVLDNVILKRWKLLPREQRHGIRNFVVGFIIKGASTYDSLRKEKVLLNKVNLVLVSILKQDWPHDWASFIPEIVSSCQTNLSICENNMVILRLLSEEVFDFSADQMTHRKTKELKTTMCNEFATVFQLCADVLHLATNQSLIKETLETLLRFLNWIPLGYIFETNIIETLITRFLSEAVFRNLTLKCLTEIGSLHVSSEKYDQQIISMFTSALGVISKFLHFDTNIREIYQGSNSKDQEFILNLSLFITNFLSSHLKLIENLPNKDYLVHAHLYLVRLSQIDDREVFKICLEYWNRLVQELYEEMLQYPVAEVSPILGLAGGQGGAPHPSLLTSLPLRKHQYGAVLSNLRQVLIEKMVKPEEVLIVENEEGEIVREFVRESDTIQLYKATRECLVYLTHLDVVDTEEIMSEKLARQVDGSEWSWANCNTLCWAIGSISGAMNEETEKRFLVTVIKDLLGLTEMKRGKDNKAVVASNIMYIVGQYPRFLKAHWKFLKTVVNKLFEFMHETHEGVQDMACDTFIKIASKCKRHFVAIQPGETEPFIDEIVRNMQKITCDLSPQQVHTFYEACGFMISAQGQRSLQERLLQELMFIPNSAWDHMIREASRDPSILDNPENVKIIGNIMKTNVAACSSIGTFFYPQLARIYVEMLSLYQAVSTVISQTIAEEGLIAARKPRMRGLRTIKKEILRLIDTFVQTTDDPDLINKNIIPPLLNVILLDYNQNIPDSKEAEVLNLVSTIITKLHNLMDSQIPLIMNQIFECTLSMINKDFAEYPEHRVAFFRLLRVINLHCFEALLKLQDEQFRLIVDACLWASKHDNREVESAGLNMCIEIVNNFAETDARTLTAFFQRYFLSILQDVFFVLTDSDHKAGFKLQTQLLARLLTLVQSELVIAPIYGLDNSSTNVSNVDYLREYLQGLLRSAFPNLERSQITLFVDQLFTTNSDLTGFKLLIRDFLIQIKEFSATGNDDLFAEDREKEIEAQKQAELERLRKVGGMLKPSEMEEVL